MTYYSDPQRPLVANRWGEIRRSRQKLRRHYWFKVCAESVLAFTLTMVAFGWMLWK